MTQGVKDLIYAIAEGDAVGIDAAFNAEMADRISACLDDMRIEVAQNMFKEQVEEEQDLELTLEDYSAEEIEEFMQTEDYEQLDELSKATLGSYVKKAKADSKYNRGENDRYRRKEKSGDLDDIDVAMGHDLKQGERNVANRNKGMKLAKSKLANKPRYESYEDDSFEQLDELSKKTLGSYVKKAAYDAVSGVHDERDAHDDMNDKEVAKNTKRVGNRLDGITRAAKKLAK